jgi:hypothetical protein
MRDRYRPAEPAPWPEFVEGYLNEADPPLRERLADPEGAEARRVAAVVALLALARAALAGAGSPDRLGAIPHNIRERLTIEGLRILTADDPVAALRRFLGERPRGRGRPRTGNVQRDGMIAADVQELVNGGAVIDEACEAIGGATGLSVQAVRKIFFDNRNRLDVRAELQLRGLSRPAG